MPVTELGGMSRRRVIAVYALVAVVVGGSVAGTITQQELYPFSPFQMFSHSYAGATKWRRTELVGVFDSGEREMEEEVVRGMTETKPAHVVLRAKHLSRKETLEQLDAYLVLLADLHDLHRETRRTALPTLRGLRVYKETFVLEPWAENRREPSRRKLVHEMLRP